MICPTKDRWLYQIDPGCTKEFNISALKRFPLASNEPYVFRITNDGLYTKMRPNQYGDADYSPQWVPIILKNEGGFFVPSRTHESDHVKRTWNHGRDPTPQYNVPTESDGLSKKRAANNPLNWSIHPRSGQPIRFRITGDIPCDEQFNGAQNKKLRSRIRVLSCIEQPSPRVKKPEIRPNLCSNSTARETPVKDAISHTTGQRRFHRSIVPQTMISRIPCQIFHETTLSLHKIYQRFVPVSIQTFRHVRLPTDRKFLALVQDAPSADGWLAIKTQNEMEQAFSKVGQLLHPHQLSDYLVTTLTTRCNGSKGGYLGQSCSAVNSRESLLQIEPKQTSILECVLHPSKSEERVELSNKRLIPHAMGKADIKLQPRTHFYMPKRISLITSMPLNVGRLSPILEQSKTFTSVEKSVPVTCCTCLVLTSMRIEISSFEQLNPATPSDSPAFCREPHNSVDNSIHTYTKTSSVDLLFEGESEGTSIHQCYTVASPMQQILELGTEAHNQYTLDSWSSSVSTQEMDEFLSVPFIHSAPTRMPSRMASISESTNQCLLSLAVDQYHRPDWSFIVHDH